MPSSIAYKATILAGQPFAISWKNTGTVDVEVMTLIGSSGAKVIGIASGPSSSDGSTKIASGAVGSAIFTPGILVMYRCKTANTSAINDQLFWDTTNDWLTTTKTSGDAFPIAGVCAEAKTSGSGYAKFLMNEYLGA